MGHWDWEGIEKRGCLVVGGSSSLSAPLVFLHNPISICYCTCNLNQRKKKRKKRLKVKYLIRWGNKKINKFEEEEQRRRSGTGSGSE